MYIMGLQKTTLLDYPGMLAATIFLGGCNFLCPYCHNSDLIFRPASLYSEEQIFAFLKKRKGVLQGVCITGGEPTLSSDLIGFISKIKDLTYKVKLDTNGTNPDTLRYLVENELIDYVAMDLKTTPSNYPSYFINKSIDYSKIDNSINYLLSNVIPYEFRTTVVRELHPLVDLFEIAELVKEAPFYYIQNFENGYNVIDKTLSGYSEEELDYIVSELKKINPHVRKRGDYI